MESKHADPFLSQGAGQMGSQPLPHLHGVEVQRFGRCACSLSPWSYQARADHSGDGRCNVHEAVDLAVPAQGIAAALFARFASRPEDFPWLRAIAILGNQVWGHSVHSATALARQPCARRGSQ